MNIAEKAQAVYERERDRLREEGLSEQAAHNDAREQARLVATDAQGRCGWEPTTHAYESQECAGRNGTRRQGDNPELAKKLLDFAYDCWREGNGSEEVQAKVRQHNLDIGSPPLTEAEADRIAAIPFREPAAVESVKLVPLTAPADRKAEPGAGPAFADPIPASQLSASGTATDWLWRGYLARGSITLLTSLWKAGKSTLLAHLVDAMGQGEDLAGLTVTQGGVLVVSEESAALWATRRDKLGIGDHALFYVRPFLGRPDARTWAAFLRHLAQLVRQRELALICFDTLAALSPCDDENDAAKMLAALTPLHLLTEAGAAVLLSHHPRKGDASEGQASRGSGALPGFVDVILEMRRAKAGRDTRQRELTAYSRFDDTPRELVIELAEDGSGYRSLGCPSQADRQSRWQTIRDLLPSEAPGKTAEELLATWPDGLAKPGKRTVEQDLQHGAETGRWSMSGTGKRGTPYRFWSNGNSFRAAMDPIAARNEFGGEGEREWTA
jgi:hypothetical protein